VARATELGLPVFHSVEDLLAWNGGMADWRSLRRDLLRDENARLRARLARHEPLTEVP
jgi:hypothetical protein